MMDIVIVVGKGIGSKHTEWQQEEWALVSAATICWMR